MQFQLIAVADWVDKLILTQCTMLVALPLRDDLPEPKGDELWCLDKNEILRRMNTNLCDVSIARDVVFVTLINNFQCFRL